MRIRIIRITHNRLRLVIIIIIITDSKQAVLQVEICAQTPVTVDQTET